MIKRIQLASGWRRMLFLSILVSMLAAAGPTTRPAGRAATQPMPTTLPAGSAVEAVQGYLRAIRAGYPEAAVTAYLDSYGMLDLVSGADAKLKGNQREEAAADLRIMIEAGWQTPGLAESMRTSELNIKTTKPVAGADGLTQVDYVLTINQPRRVELPNTMYLHKAKDGWRIVDMNQANQPRMSEALRAGYAQVKKVEPSATLEQFLFDVMRSVRRKMQAATQAVTTRPGGLTTRPIGR